MNSDNTTTSIRDGTAEITDAEIESPIYACTESAASTYDISKYHIQVEKAKHHAHKIPDSAKYVNRLNVNPYYSSSKNFKSIVLKADEEELEEIKAVKLDPMISVSNIFDKFNRQRNPSRYLPEAINKSCEPLRPNIDHVPGSTNVIHRHPADDNLFSTSRTDRQLDKYGVKTIDHGRDKTGRRDIVKKNVHPNHRESTSLSVTDIENLATDDLDSLTTVTEAAESYDAGDFLQDYCSLESTDHPFDLGTAAACKNNCANKLPIGPINPKTVGNTNIHSVMRRYPEEVKRIVTEALKQVYASPQLRKMAHPLIGGGSPDVIDSILSNITMHDKKDEGSYIKHLPDTGNIQDGSTKKILAQSKVTGSKRSKTTRNLKHVEKNLAPNQKPSCRRYSARSIDAIETKSRICKSPIVQKQSPVITNSRTIGLITNNATKRRTIEPEKFNNNIDDAMPTFEATTADISKTSGLTTSIPLKTNANTGDVEIEECQSTADDSKTATVSLTKPPAKSEVRIGKSTKGISNDERAKCASVSHMTSTRIQPTPVAINTNIHALSRCQLVTAVPKLTRVKSKNERSVPGYRVSGSTQNHSKPKLHVKIMAASSNKDIENIENPCYPTLSTKVTLAPTTNQDVCEPVLGTSNNLSKQPRQSTSTAKTSDRNRLKKRKPVWHY